MNAVFEWHEHGRSIVATTEPGSGLTVATRTDGWSWSAIELPGVAVHELREALVETIGDPQRAELLETMHATEQQLGDAERDRDAEHERADRLEAQLREALALLETHKSAGEIADRRARALEAELEGRYPTISRARR